MAESSHEDRTEQATPQRRREAREKGRVARSADLNNAFVFTIGIVLLSYVGRDVLLSMAKAMRGCLMQLVSDEFTTGQAQAVFSSALMAQFGALTPFLAGLAMAATAIAYGQAGGVLVTPEAILPKFERINPINGMGRLFSKAALARTGTAMAKLIVITTVAGLTIRSHIRSGTFLQVNDVHENLKQVAGIVFVLGLRVGLVLLVIAIFDYAFQRWQHEQGLRMTKDELKEEMKRYEGDPHVKARVRQIQREMAQRRMMQDVETADVVVTNPTNFAVALKYDREAMAAPKVVAKGADLVAKRIIQVAKDHNVPRVENRPLARALYGAAKIGEEVPPKFYQAVAELLAYIYRLRSGAVV